MVILRACITLVNISSQMVQVLGFIRLGRTPNARNGAEITPRSGTGRCICSQQPMQNLECCKAGIFDRDPRAADRLILQSATDASKAASPQCTPAGWRREAKLLGSHQNNQNGGSPWTP